MWNGSGGFDGSREFDRSLGSGGSRGSDWSRRSDDYIGCEPSGGYNGSGDPEESRVDDGSGGSGGPRVNDGSGGSGGPRVNNGSGGSGGPRVNDISGGSGGPRVNDISGGSRGPCVYDVSRGFGGPCVFDGPNGLEKPRVYERTACIGTARNFFYHSFDGSLSSGVSGGRAPEMAIRFGLNPGLKSNSLRPSPSIRHNLQEPPNQNCWCYFVALAGLWGCTIAQLEQHTRVKASVLKTLPEVAAFYNDAGYKGGYQQFDSGDQLKEHLRQLFRCKWEITEESKREYLQMKLAAGYMYSVKKDGHAVVIKVWTQDNQPMYRVVDYTFDDEERTATERELPEDSEVRIFFCFAPYFDCGSAEINPSVLRKYQL